MARKTFRKLLLTLITAFVLTLSWSGTVFADGDRVEALEARIAELEALVQTLLDRQRDSEEAIDAVAVESAAVEAAEAKVLVMMEEQRAAQEAEAKKTVYKFGGYAKADIIYSDYSSGSVASANAGRDFYIPATVPVGPPGSPGESYLDLHAKESRLNFRVDHITDSGAKIGAFIEMDFLLSASGDERISNSYNPRLRHAFVTYDKWLFGQTWMTFLNVAALPENLDFVGPAESTIFGRQVMVRYTNGPWQFAIENPETTITPYGGGTRIVADDNQVPDGVLRYNFTGDWGSFTAAGIIRQMAYQDNAAGIDDSTTGYGVSLSGVFKLGSRDDFRWMASAGKGLGRYIGLNTANGAVLDMNGKLHTIDSWGAFGSFRHFWNEKWRSNLTLGYLDVDNPVQYTGLSAAKQAFSGHLNLIYSPWPKLDFGVEFMYADRELENGNDGDMKRLQFSAKYAF
jgi:hypothetical protein